MSAAAAGPAERHHPDRPLVVITESLNAVAAAWLAERCDLANVPFTDAAALRKALATAAGLVIRTYTRIDAALLDQAPALRVVGRAGVGLDNIDVAECRRRGVRIVHTPDANGQAVAEFVLALLLDALRPRRYLTQALIATEWEAARRALVAPRQLSDLTLGVLGLGRIGTRTARLGSALGMRTLYHDLVEPPPDRRAGATPVAFDELLASSDVLSIHVDPRPGNRALISTGTLARCKPTVILVNTSRGLVVDTPALAAFLQAHPQALALLDVHDPEPIAADSPLLGLHNARLTPHLAAATATAHANMSLVVRDVWRVLHGEAPEHEASA